jgi:stress-induced morphogen
VTTDEVKRLIEEGIPGATATVGDLTGTGDHFKAEVVAAAFRGKSMIEQHRMVYAALGALMGGPIHALQLTTSGAPSTTT